MVAVEAGAFSASPQFCSLHSNHFLKELNICYRVSNTSHAAESVKYANTGSLAAKNLKLKGGYKSRKVMAAGMPRVKLLLHQTNAI